MAKIKVDNDDYYKQIRQLANEIKKKKEKDNGNGIHKSSGRGNR